MSDKFTAALAAMLLLTACGRHDGIKVTVDNNLDFDRNTEMAELPADSVLAMLGSEYCYITDSDGNEVPSQITTDRLLIFRPSVKARQSAVYTSRIQCMYMNVLLQDGSTLNVPMTSLGKTTL